MKEKVIINKHIMSGDRIKIFMLSSLFCVLITILGCGKVVTMHKPESVEVGIEGSRMDEGSGSSQGSGSKGNDNQGNEWSNSNSLKTSIEDAGRESSLNSKKSQDMGQESGDVEGAQKSLKSGEESQYAVNRIRVHICGEVTTPGVYEIDEGSRVIDAVELAGGFTDKACEDDINLAGILVDSARVYIPNEQDIRDMKAGKNGNMYLDQSAAYYAFPYVTASYPLMNNQSANKSSNTAENSGKILININTAGEAELVQITGIGQTRARSIIEYRQKNGPFNKIEDIQKVSGIGAASFAKMKDMITVD